jgi:hypothetical protein
VEDLLNLPPTNLFDSHAPVFTPMFSGPGTQPAFSVDDRNLRNGMIYEANGPKAPAAKQSAKLDFSKPDLNDPAILNAILWADAVARGAVGSGANPLP